MTRESVFEPGNVAVITGAAMGIGRELSLQLAQKGMSVVMADLAGDHFSAAVSAVEKVAVNGSQTVIAVETDVSDPDQVVHLKDTALARFGAVHFLANNAVTRMGRGIDADMSEWRQAMEVNLWGPIYGVRTFLPALLDSSGPAAIVNVGSKQGITNPPGHPVYNISKSALKTYTEALQHELRNHPDNQGEDPVTAHLLVPGWTTTGTADHKPGAWLPAQVIDLLLRGILAGDFYIVCPDDEVTPEMDRKRILWAAGDITENRPPLSRWHPDYADVARRNCS